ncbi:MAG: hypothetical protein ACTHNT_04545, partial [Actinomycetales bacterium]
MTCPRRGGHVGFRGRCLFAAPRQIALSPLAGRLRGEVLREVAQAVEVVDVAAASHDLGDGDT